MLFNSKEFAIFFGIVLVIYWLCYRWRLLQNLVLLAANYYFYNNLHWSFPLYLLGMIVVGYSAAMLISRYDDKSRRKPILVTGIIILGFGLTYIKYSGLILGNIPGLQQWQASALHILVPLGISYYTFSSIGYITDIYRRKIDAEKNFVTYAAYISFFPHLLSGPIASSVAILPKFRTVHVPTWEEVQQSLGEIIWGLFKKMVMAANVETVVNYCFSRYTDLNGATLFLGIVLFNFYLYADFSAYSDIARGVGRLLGIELAQNFKMPFFSRNPGEFWRRWHTSLRKWMLDYLYLPLGGNKGSQLHYIMVMLFIFSFSGLWHGANVTFICWGLLNGLYFLPYILTDKLTRYKDVVAKGRLLPSIKELFQMIFIFIIMTLTRIFFRSPDMTVAKGIAAKIFSPSLFAIPVDLAIRSCLIFIPMFVIEWIQRDRLYVLQTGQVTISQNKATNQALNLFIRFAFYGLVIAATVIWHKQKNMSEYYYFKF